MHHPDQIQTGDYTYRLEKQWKVWNAKGPWKDENKNDDLGVILAKVQEHRNLVDQFSAAEDVMTKQILRIRSLERDCQTLPERRKKLEQSFASHLGVKPILSKAYSGLPHLNSRRLPEIYTAPDQMMECILRIREALKVFPDRRDYLVDSFFPKAKKITADSLRDHELWYPSIINRLNPAKAMIDQAENLQGLSYQQRQSLLDDAIKSLFSLIQEVRMFNDYAPYLLDSGKGILQEIAEAYEHASQLKAGFVPSSLTNSTATLSGVLVETVSGKRVPNATVHIFHGKDQQEMIVYTDANGHFDTGGLIPGNISYRVVKKDYYESAGAIAVRDGEKKNLEIQIAPYPANTGNQPPIADCSVWPESGSAPLTVEVDATESFSGNGGKIVDYQWELSGNPIRKDVSPGYLKLTYTQPGTYQINVTVVDNRGGRDSTSLQVTVTGSASPGNDDELHAVLVVTPWANNGLGATFDTTQCTNSTGSIVTYELDFMGDGTWDYTHNNSIVMGNKVPKPGTYTAVLRITGSHGMKTSTTQTYVIADSSSREQVFDAGDDEHTPTRKESLSEQQAYQKYIAAYNKLTSLMAKGQGDTPQAQEAYQAYKKAKDEYERMIRR